MNIKYHVIVVGCGGTGSFFIKEFARFLSTTTHEIYLTLIDGDTVEAHNLDRQAFKEEDIGEAKCVVLADALCSCLSIPMERLQCYPMYLSSKAELLEIYQTFLYGHGENGFYSSTKHQIITFLIGAVDNHAARKVMHEAYEEMTGAVFYFDSANEYSNGEVVFSGKTLKGDYLAPPRANLFPEILETTEVSRAEQGCSEINIHEPQHIVTNMLAANLLLSKTCSVIQGKPVELGVAFFDAMNCFVQFYPADNGKKKGRKKANGTKTTTSRSKKTA